MENPFEALQQQISQLQGTLNQLLARPVAVQQTTELPIGIEQASTILLMSVKTIYQNTDKIPHYKRNGKLYFFESELLDYIRNKPDSTSTTATIKQTRIRQRPKAASVI